MSKKTLAELRAAPRAARPERSISVCLAPDLVAEAQAIIEKMEALPVAGIRAATTEPEDGPPLRMGEVRTPAVDPAMEDLKAQLRDVVQQMGEHEGLLGIRATPTDGEWRNWVNANPARGDDKPAEYQRDREVARGYCNADALIDDLEKYAYSWNGEPLAPGDWVSVIEPRVTNPDKKKIAQAIVGMYEQVTDLGKWVWDLSETLRSADDDSAPAQPAGPPRSTLDESQPNATSTTTPTTS